MHDVTRQLGKRRFGPYTLKIRNAETIAILGPNGVGKSTLLKLLSGAYQPSSGHICLNDRRLNSWSADILSQHRTVLNQSQDIAFPLATAVVIRLGRVARARDVVCDQIVARAAEMLDVSHLLERTVDTLSGGELARVHLARICAQLWDVEEGFILMDEPIAAVDPGLQDLMLETLMRFARMRRHAVVAIVHDINHALRYFSRLVLLHTDGQLESIESGPEAKHALERLYSIRLSCLHDEQGDLVMLPLRRNTQNLKLPSNSRHD
jgi:iron complex transport system ATP-binding protein